MASPLARSSAALVAVATLALSASAQTLPQDFALDQIGRGWLQPTCICFCRPTSDSDLLVTEKAGLLWLVHDGTKQLKPVIDLQDEILNNGDRGLLSVQVDPDWEHNGRIYLLYIVDPNGDGNDAEQESFGRLTAYTTSFDTNGDLVADPASRQVLIGATWPEGIPSIHLSHSVGDMRWGTDGSLFVSAGDGAHYDFTDVGGNDPGGFGPGKFPPSEDIGAFRSQSVTSLAGKILRIDPATGLGLPSNPYWTGTASDNESRVWASGLRNPFRISLIPNSGTPGQLYVSDVGWNNFEELNWAQGQAENFGWPCMEGRNANNPYVNNDPYGDCTNLAIFQKPIWTYHHWWPGTPGFVGQCVTGSQVYTGSDYPQKYLGHLFYCDYASDWVRTITFDAKGNMLTNDPFASGLGNPVGLIQAPTNGDLLFIAIGSNSIYRMRYTKVNRPPVIVASATPTYGPSPLSVLFDATGTTDPEGKALTYLWEFGDGKTDSNVSVTKKYKTADHTWTAKLTVTDADGASSTWSQVIETDNTPPVIRQLVSPLPGSFFVNGNNLTFDAVADDAEDTPLGIPLTATWNIDMVHEHHTHPAWATLNGLTANWTATGHEHGFYFHVTLTVTDSRGLTASQAFDVYDQDATPEPHLVSITDASPRMGVEVTAVAHLHYAGHGAAPLVVDWGDGFVDSFVSSHFQDETSKHTYVAPGRYTLRVRAGQGRDASAIEQPIDVRPLFPGVAVFAPIDTFQWMSGQEQWNVASGLVSDLRDAGFEAELFGNGSQDALQTWLTNYLNDGVRDYLVCLDEAPAVVYSGQDDNSLAEQWLDAGNGVLWTGYNPFAYYALSDGTDDSTGADLWALDELLDAATPQLVSGTGTMVLGPDAAAIPSLNSFVSAAAVDLSKLDPVQWPSATIYASDNPAAPTISDALVLQNATGGEYAQFHCAANSLLPRRDVLREFLLSHLFTNLPKGAGHFDLLYPPDKWQSVPVLRPVFTWESKKRATSWLFELAHDAEFKQVVEVQTVTQPTATVQTTLVPKTVYYWRVTARNDYGTYTAPSRSFRSAKPLVTK
jgi:glucose/arabinose dehydrogenase